MGRKMYEQILILFPQKFLYKDRRCFVFSRSVTGSNEEDPFINDDVSTFT